jgi:hypothetical protein
MLLMRNVFPITSTSTEQCKYLKGMKTKWDTTSNLMSDEAKMWSLSDNICLFVLPVENATSHEV